MTALRDRALETRIKGITGEECQDGRVVIEALIGAVVVDERLEAGGATRWVSGAGSEGG